MTRRTRTLTAQRPRVPSRSRRNAMARSVAARTLALAIGLGLTLTSATAHAHRLDEILQSAFLAIEPDRIRLELHLTPGIETFAGLAPALDPDRDGEISRGEAGSFAQTVRTNLQLALNGRDLDLALNGVECPALDTLKDGTGTVSLRFSATAGMSPGSHVLRFHNGHRPRDSVHLANALQPESPELIRITRQDRSIDQREILVSFERRSAPGAPHAADAAAGTKAPALQGWHFLLAAVAGTLACVWRARQRVRSGSPAEAP